MVKGKFALELQYFALSVEWLELALKKLEKDGPSEELNQENLLSLLQSAKIAVRSLRHF